MYKTLDVYKKELLGVGKRFRNNDSDSFQKKYSSTEFSVNVNYGNAISNNSIEKAQEKLVIL